MVSQCKSLGGTWWTQAKRKSLETCQSINAYYYKGTVQLYMENLWCNSQLVHFTSIYAFSIQRATCLPVGAALCTTTTAHKVVYMHTDTLKV